MDMIDSTINEEMDKDSLSSESVSRDSLTDGKENCKSNRIKRKGSYTIEDSSQTLSNIPKVEQTTQNEQDYSELRQALEQSLPQKNNMTQSMFERPWETGKRNTSVASALAKQREEKIKLAKEEQKRRHKEKLLNFNQSIKMTESVLKRKEEEKNKKLEEKKLKEKERKRVVEERKQRLLQAEETRKAQLLQRLIGKENVAKQRPSTAGAVTSENLMTMSCYGGIGRQGGVGATTSVTGRHKKEVVPRFYQARPVSSTGKVIGFGSSVPRNICETNSKPKPKKIPDYLMERLEVLSRPSSARLMALNNASATSMTTSVMVGPTSRPSSTQVSSRASIREKAPTSRSSNMMVTSMIDYSTSSVKKQITRPSTLMKSKKESKLSNSMTQSKIDKNSQPIKPKMTHSRSFTKSKPRNKVDSHLDSDSIEEENTTNISMTSRRSAPVPRKKTSNNITQNKNDNQRKTKSDLSSDSMDTTTANTTTDMDNQKPTTTTTTTTITTTTPTTMSKEAMLQNNGKSNDSQADYRARLLENRRLAREKREKEREQKMKEAEDREKKLMEEASQTALKKEREQEKDEELLGNSIATRTEESSEDAHLTPTSNDEITGEKEFINASMEPEESELSKVPELTIQQQEELKDAEIPDEPILQTPENPETDTKKRLETIMSRIKRTSPNPATTTEESSNSEGGGISPRRAMSPEPSELDPQGSASQPPQQFRSSILQSMVNKGRLSRTNPATQSSAINQPIDDTESSKVSPSSALSAVRESLEDNDSVDMNHNSKSSAAIRSSGVDGNSLSDANSDFGAEASAPEIPSQDVRSPCDGMEDIITNAPCDPLLTPDSPAAPPVPQNGHYPCTSSVSDEDLSLCATNISSNQNVNNNNNNSILLEQN